MAQPPGDGSNSDRRPDPEAWGIVNSVTDMPQVRPGESETPREKPDLRPPTTPPQDVSEISAGQIRSKSGFVWIVVALGLGAGLYYLATTTPQRDLSVGAPIQFSAPTLQELGKGGLEVAPPPLPARRTLKVESQPPGATVLVNGNLVEAKTPSGIDVIAARAGTASFSLDGHLPHLEQYKQEQSNLSVVLKPGVAKPGSLTLDSVPTGALVHLNGQEVGKTPIEQVEAPGAQPLHLRFSLEGHHAHTVITSVDAAEKRRMTIPLAPKAGPRKMATIRIESAPLVTRIHDLSPGMERAYMGATGYRALTLNQRIGDQLHVVASAPKHDEQELWLDAQDASYTVHIRLKAVEQAWGSLSLSGPKKLMVFVDSEEIDGLPLTSMKVEAGERTIVVLDPETRTRAKFTVKLTKGEKVRRRITYKDGAIELR